MAADPLDQVLRLVAEGRLTAEEAAPILAALDEQGSITTAGPQHPRRDRRPEPPGGFGFDAPPGFGFDTPTGPADWPFDSTAEPGPDRQAARSGSRSVTPAATSSTCGSRSPWAGSPSSVSPACRPTRSIASGRR